MPDRLFLIDSSALAYRSFYAFIKNPLVNSKGQQTSALFGYVSQVLRIIHEEKPSHIAVICDLKAPTFRHKLFTDYKATRKPMPEELKEQLPAIDEFISVSGIPMLAREGYEADDIMGTLAVTASHKDMQVMLVTKDKDMMQVVSETVFLYEPGTRAQPALLRGPEQVREKFGVGPGQMVNLLALMGDASDNIPGVTKVGPKTAADLLNAHGSLEKIYQNVDNITRKALRENLKKDRERAFLSRELVTLDCGVPLEHSLDDLTYRAGDPGKLEAFLREWELDSLLRYMPGKGDTGQQELERQTQQRARYRTPDTANTGTAMVRELKNAPVIAIDTETTGLDKLTAGLVGLCLSTGPRTGWYIPVGHVGAENVGIEKIKEMLGPVLADTTKKFVLHNAKFDLPILERYGLSPQSGEHLIDTMVAAHLLAPGVRGLSLEELALKYLNYQMIPIEQLIGKKGKDQKSFAEVPVTDACIYGAEDADITLRLWREVEPKLRDQGLLDLFHNLEMKLLPVLQKMEMRGISLNTAALHGLSASLEKELLDLEKSIYAEAGEEFNIESPQQLSRILFEKLGLKTGKKTKTGFSTDVTVLTELSGNHPVIDHLLHFRELVKLKNTYVDVLPDLVHERTGRVHTSYSQTIAATGRLSSVNPNLQNIPIRTGEGRKIRECFVSRSAEYVLLAADYSQIELRVLAHLSGDPDLGEAYKKGLDIHMRTAAVLYDVPEEEVSADMRRNAKVVNFGILYGMGPRRLSRELNIPMDQASRFIENYFSKYPRVKTFMRGTVEKARKNGYVQTFSGRKRFLPELVSANRGVVQNAERMAANTPIQGSAADLIKHAMIAVDLALGTSGLDCEMLLQVHDELVFEVAAQDVDNASAVIRNSMEKALELSVPVKVDIGSGRTWLEAHG